MPLTSVRGAENIILDRRIGLEEKGWWDMTLTYEQTPSLIAGSGSRELEWLMSINRGERHRFRSLTSSLEFQSEQ